MDNSRVYKMSFASIHPLYLQKAENKMRTKAIDSHECTNNKITVVQQRKKIVWKK